MTTQVQRGGVGTPPNHSQPDITRWEVSTTLRPLYPHERPGSNCTRVRGLSGRHWKYRTHRDSISGYSKPYRQHYTNQTPIRNVKGLIIAVNLNHIQESLILYGYFLTSCWGENLHLKRRNQRFQIISVYNEAFYNRNSSSILWGWLNAAGCNRWSMFWLKAWRKRFLAEPRPKSRENVTAGVQWTWCLWKCELG
jgi:hypothetical protein